jgi:hypothetical protein
MSGYGPVELIGEPTCVSYHVPFIRPRTGPMTESRFWSTPDSFTSSVAPRLPPVRPPLCRYTREIQQERQRQKKARLNDGKSAPSGQDEKGLATVEVDEDAVEQVSTPDDWGVEMKDLKKGRFVVVESIFDPDDEAENRGQRRGISVTKVVAILL